MITENCAQEALKFASPLDRAEKLVFEHAIAAVNELRQYNEKYALEKLEDNFDLIKAEPARPNDPVVGALSRYYLTLLNRRGLVA